ncbi:MAG: hypothetical protein CVU09_17530 [Bacteroidetes bacterium HGW-Bacteroidetes-4]|nr:MAG: hypothetical protein CVU09_17530 [Bacteroidetes bacterium HGW-Bacteroidetes-4]
MSNMIITPKSKIFELLEAYPELEDVLIAAAPQFKKLQNPVLRKTVAKITNLSQAATIGGINVEELVNTLRAKVGQNLESFNQESSTYNTIQPDWFREEGITQVIDIREMLDAGDQPVHEVMAALKKTGSEAILQLIAPFLPAPLIDKSLSLGHEHWVNKRSDTNFLIYFKGL